MGIYFTSDTHFNHENILSFCHRPFTGLNSMNEGLIENWNSRVNKDDTVYHLGDFAMGPKELHAGFLKRLNGKKILVRGNHDSKKHHIAYLTEGLWQAVTTHVLEQIDGLNIYMSHIPPKEVDPYKDRYYPPDLTTQPFPIYDYWLCGHVHEAFDRKDKVINVGVDVRQYKPKTLQELLNGH